MANNSHPHSKEEIHKELIDELRDGYVGYERNTRAYDRWKSKFANYCNQTAVIDGGVMGHFEYLDSTGKISPGNYNVLKDIFTGDNRALKRIDQAVLDIENLAGVQSSAGNKKPDNSYKNSTAPIKKEESGPNRIQMNEAQATTENSYKNRTSPIKKEECGPNRIQMNEAQATNNVTRAAIVVPIRKEQHNTGRIIAIIIGKLINNIKRIELDIGVSAVEKGYNIVHGKENMTSSFGEKVQAAEKRLIDKLGNVCSDGLADKMRSILKIWFNLFRYLETNGLSVLGIGWENSIIIVAEGRTFTEDTPWTHKVESHIQNIFTLIGQDDVVTVVTVKPLSYDAAEQLLDILNSLVI